MPIPGDLEQYRRISAKERVFSLLREWITDGTLQPGEKIVDSELAQAIGVSRTPVREALQMLELQGFVEMHPGKETKVSGLSEADVFQLYPPLAVLDSLASELAADRMEKETVRELEGINEKFAKAVEDRDRNRALEWDERFHRTIVEASENPYLADFTSVLQLHIRRLKFVFFDPSMVPAQTSVEEHRAIIEALKTGDGKRAARVMKQNWLRAMNTVAEEIRCSGTEGGEKEARS
ncbi:DNA-binding GntR family transcriptional regulator [Melghirimyces profundicolus]|uniref:DNA-binding GntR family transcriptional regulator n=1 Tax=Melghirimyces profundicolus TaxID=1242148 RepID=A0A2T6B823_9BACL|nr:GntR family transcriptional regulator [Melghirimyces profundicolus]PTX52203.1 DNA-binding GntR family transcriptional regulator [Melghirimyces profundicolus]